MSPGTGVHDWGVGWREGAPPRLLARVDEVFAAHPSWGDLDRSEAFVAAGGFLLGGVLFAGRDEARDGALDLLAADACVTWAFEAAADAPEGIGARALEAMRRLAEVAR